MSQSSVLVIPAHEHLASYREALERGWSPDTVQPDKTALRELSAIDRNSADFLSGLTDEEAVGDPIQLPDGTTVPRLPGFRRWVWDGELCGSIGFRWQPGSSELPSYVLGHIGFTIVPWKRGRGHAKRALAALLPEARSRGLEYVYLTADPDNVASQRVIQSAGGQLVERSRKHAAYGEADILRYRIIL
ncbi:MAG: GNAT family N-acetyltransferase [Pseudomonadota bacterium]